MIGITAKTGNKLGERRVMVYEIDPVKIVQLKSAENPVTYCLVCYFSLKSDATKAVIHRRKKKKKKAAFSFRLLLLIRLTDERSLLYDQNESKKFESSSLRGQTNTRKKEDEIFSCAFSQQKTTKLLQLSRENIKLSYRARSQQH